MGWVERQRRRPGWRGITARRATLREDGCRRSRKDAQVEVVVALAHRRKCVIKALSSGGKKDVWSRALPLTTQAQRRTCSAAWPARFVSAEKARKASSTAATACDVRASNSLCASSARCMASALAAKFWCTLALLMLPPAGEPSGPDPEGDEAADGVMVRPRALLQEEAIEAAAVPRRPAASRAASADSTATIARGWSVVSLPSRDCSGAAKASVPLRATPRSTPRT